MSYYFTLCSFPLRRTDPTTPSARLPQLVSTFLPSICAGYGILYGIRYAHNIYPLANAFFLWLAANNSDLFVGAAYEAVVGKRRSSQLPAARKVAAVVAGDGTRLGRDLAKRTIG